MKHFAGIHNWLLILLAVISVMAVTSCSEPSDLGMELLPASDLVSVKNLVEKNSISAFTHREDSVRTSKPRRSLLGSLNDPLFGTTTIDFATQVRLQDFPDYGTNPVADSVKLYMYYRLIYGDTTTTQHFNVYELQSALDPDATYYQDVDLKALASDQLLGEIDYKPKVRLDSTTADTFYQLITIPLDVSLAEKLINADSSQMVNNDVFLNYFKGLYIESEKQTEAGGTILSLEASSGSGFQGSALVVYYNNAENIAETEPDTLLMPYLITPFSARVNSIGHDYTGTPFYDELNSETGPDTLIYVQATGGLKARVLIDDLSLWRDSVNTAINKAELVFQIDTVASEVDKFPPPSQLLFTAVDENGKEFLPIDYSFSAAFYNGILNKNDYTYHFNITQHLQQIIEGNIENYGFYLTTARKNDEARRVVLKGSESQTGIKLIITYTKYAQ